MAGRSLTVPAAVRKAIIEHARREQPLECCGLLVGTGSRVAYAVAMRNAAASATRYRIDETSHIDVRRVLRGMQPRLEIVGVYHSHPAGNAQPSRVDLDEAMYPEWAYVIVGLEPRRPDVRAFRILRGEARALTIR
jgi:proteasome lid subunit RPN8/RPN11